MMFQDKVMVTFLWFTRPFHRPRNNTWCSWTCSLARHSHHAVLSCPITLPGSVCSFIFSRQIQEQLLHVPVEQGVEVSLQVECQEPKIILFLPGCVVRHVLDHHLDRVYVSMHLVLVEECRQEAEESQASQDRHGVSCQGVSPSEGRVHCDLISL